MQIHFCTAACAKSLGGRDYEEENWERFIGCKAFPTTFPLLGFFTFGDWHHIHTVERNSLEPCPNLDISTQLAAFGVISHHRLHPTSAQVHFPLHNCWIPASETRCHGLQLALPLLQKSGAARRKRFLAKRVSQLLLSTEGRSLPAVADGDVFPGSCVNQMKREQLFPLASCRARNGQE